MEFKFIDKKPPISYYYGMLKGKLKPQIGLKSIILVAVCGLLLAADLLTKHFAKLQLWDVKIIPGWVELNGYVPNNQGCAFSFLNDNPQIGQPLFITLTFIMLAVMIAVFIFLPERFTILKICLTLVIAGATGNLADRLAFRSVRDFFGLNMLFNGGLVYCNLADFYVVTGAILAIVDLLFLNEFAVIPLTKKAKAAQSAKNAQSQQVSEENTGKTGENTDESENQPPKTSPRDDIDGV